MTVQPLISPTFGESETSASTSPSKAVRSLLWANGRKKLWLGLGSVGRSGRITEWDVSRGEAMSTEEVQTRDAVTSLHSLHPDVVLAEVSFRSSGLALRPVVSI
jgi:hypothetical protein